MDKLRRALDPVSMPSDLLNLGCLRETRRDLLSDITTWIDNYSTSNVLWIYGAPGTGKTTIFWSLIAELRKKQRCAGVFLSEQENYTPSMLWRTLAYKIATFDPAIESEIYNNVANLTADESYLDDVQITFSKLVYGPLEKTKTSISSRRDPVILIDAFDQCRQAQDNSRDRETLLNTLLQWSSLPSHCKLIITSRPQSDIAKTFEEREIKRVELRVGDNLDDHTDSDVNAYLRYGFADMRRQDKSILKDWPNNDAIIKLVSHTKGFFKWAAVAIDSIKAAGDKNKQLAALIESGTATKLDDFDKYLEKVLESTFEDGSFKSFDSNPGASENHSFDVFRDTIGMNAFSKEPLMMADIERFLQGHFKSASGVSINLKDVCYRLLQIISIEDERKTIKIRHKAYKDYLTDPKRCTSKFFVDRAKVHKKMTISCLKIMQQDLKFNICGLKSSYRLNDEVDDMDVLIKKCIPSSLAYACKYWVDHLRGVASTEKSDVEIINLLRNFLDSHLLYWLEVLSLLSKSDIASKSLLSVAEWLEVC